MSEVIHADIFFFITGIAVIVCSAVLCVALFHAIKVLKSMRRIMNRIEASAEMITEDMYHIREYFTQEGFLSRLFATLTGSASRARTRAQQSKSERKKGELKIKGEA